MRLIPSYNVVFDVVFGLLVFVAVLFAPPAFSQNLLSNGEFDTNLSPWTLGGQEFIEINWRSADVDGSLISGSLETYSGSGGPYQCVPVSGNTSYFLDGYVAPLSLDRSGTTDHTIRIEWYNTTNCGFGAALSTDSLPFATTLDSFERLNGTFVAPLSANSARVRLVAVFTTGGFARALYDSVYMPEPGFAVGMGAGMFVLSAFARRRAPKSKGA